MKYETTFEGKPIEILDCSVEPGRRTRAGVEGADYEFGKIPNSDYVTCVYKDAVYVVLKTDKTVRCTCEYFRKNQGMICEHLLALREIKEDDYAAAPADIVTLLGETEGWTVNDAGKFTPPSKHVTLEVVAELPPENEEVPAVEQPTEKPAPKTGAKKPLCVATCQYCEMKIKAATQEKADERCTNHEKMCKKRPADEPDVSKMETTEPPANKTPMQVTHDAPPEKEKPTTKVKPTTDTKPVKKAHPTPAAVAKDAVKTYTCKICGEVYHTSDEALNCIESHQALQEIEETRALVGTTGKTSDQRWSDAQIEVMKKTVAIGATPAEFAYFLNVAKYSGLNPFLREIYFIKTEKGQVSIITARDGYLTIAKRDQRFQGVQSMEVCEKDTFTVDTAMDESGNIAQVVHHQITNFIDRGDIIGAWARGQMRGEEPVIIFTSMKEYDKSKQPKGGKMWNQYPSSMIRKVAEAMVLKRIAGISGLVTDAEINTDLQIVDAEVV
jgi:phage recombination protein Bet